MIEVRRGTPRWTATLFDLDGTLVDTRPGVRSAIEAAFEEVSGNAPPGHEADLSLPLDEMIRSLAPSASADRQEQLSEAFRRHYDTTHWASVLVYPGAEDCLRMLRDAGERVFVVTNKRATAAKRLLEHLGMARYLEAIVGQADTGSPVPKGVLLDRCMGAAGLDPSTAVVVGDSDQDAAATRSRGMVFIAVTSGAGPLGHATAGEERVEVGSLAEATTRVLNSLRGEDREP